jgi:hypothetical protein
MGQVLFQYPISKPYKILLGVVIVWLTGVVFVSVVSVIRSGWLASSVLLPAICPIFFLFCMYSISRFEVRAAGIWSQGKFTKWEALTAFQWKEEGEYKLGLGKEAYILGLNVPGDSFPQWLERYKFQRDQREDIDKLLSQYLLKAA